MCGATLLWVESVSGADRSIPACAGQHETASDDANAPEGASPRVRGNTLTVIDEPLVHREHPRVCGATPMVDEDACAAVGEHPRVCGATQQRAGARGPMGGSIPACAGQHRGASGRSGSTQGASPRVRGNTKWIVFSRHFRWEHPRVCGATPQRLNEAEELTRSIPACAGQHGGATTRDIDTEGASPRVRGNTTWGTADELGSKEHPRVCGATPRRHTTKAMAPRSIPACAGQHLQPSMTAFSSSGASPRVRGNTTADELGSHCGEEHPRVCGATRSAIAGKTQNRRSIPACAGQHESEPLHAKLRQGASPRVRGNTLLQNGREVS